ncbi:Alpha-glucan water dikinase 1, chloroplastic [Cymbomonas tetramitiformis]|uniref:Alpha-glucan water dikinase 1, chloroplastic n=1 Tax=Cymbomonas tetramitiformis TaxID=36881 RepID=A0AAE0FBG7_9CHLO|nr:Alpha-glucan water dikinase 1, chloroplastic [Cymbomonas tetramitiformis]
MRNDIHGHREKLYLDLALEAQVKASIERGFTQCGSSEAVMALLQPALENLCLTTPYNRELCRCLCDMQRLPDGWSRQREGALQAVAVLDRVRRALGELSDVTSGAMQPHADRLGHAISDIPQWQRELFTEELIRSSPAFAVSLLLSTVDPMLRAAAELGVWQIISPIGSATVGRVEVVEGLHLVQDKVYSEPTVLVSNEVSGEEEIPDGVVALITPHAPDVLSHVSVRARNCQVLFVTCFDPGMLDSLKQEAGAALEMSLTPAGDVLWKRVEDGALRGGAAEAAVQASGASLAATRMAKPEWCGKNVVQMDEFQDGVVGAKSKNLAGLRGKLPSAVELPPSMSLPFGTFEAVLAASENLQVARQLAATYDQLDEAHPGQKLEECRALVLQLQAPSGLQESLVGAAAVAGVPWPVGADGWEAAFGALKAVWASQYNERSYVSLRKAGLPHSQLCMAVLVQRVVPADYAFVIHTVNPSTNDTSEIYVEMVRGLGETLVGNYSGRALAAVVPKSNLDSPKVVSFFSKSVGLFVPETLIFRSDSNGEDLDGYAGAGLYDSITMHPMYEAEISHSEDALMRDPALRSQVLSAVARLGLDVEQALGSPQDVEGVVEMTSQGLRITVVQTRPQMCTSFNKIYATLTNSTLTNLVLDGVVAERDQGVPEGPSVDGVVGERDHKLEGCLRGCWRGRYGDGAVGERKKLWVLEGSAGRTGLWASVTKGCREGLLGRMGWTGVVGERPQGVPEGCLQDGRGGGRA